MNVVPVIDPNVKHIGVSKLRGLNASNLKEKTTTNTYVIQDNDTPLAVLLSYENFLMIQAQMREVINTLDLLCDQAELAGLKAGLDDAAAGRVRSLAEIRAEISKARG
jgi:predicted transcriptional regulator